MNGFLQVIMITIYRRNVIMKKLLFAISFAVSAMLFVSCQKEENGKITPIDESAVEDTEGVLMSFTTPAGPDVDTRMSYQEETGTGEHDGQWRITKTWQNGDELIGYQIDTVKSKINPNQDSVYVNKYFTYEATVAGNTVVWNRISGSKGFPKLVDAEDSKHYATYFTYAPGIKASQFGKADSIVFDLSNQINGQIPSLTSGVGYTFYDSDAAATKVNVQFTNHLAMLAISNAVMADANSDTKVNYFTIVGVGRKVTIKPAESSDKVCSVTDLGDLKGISICQPDDSTNQWIIGENGAFNHEVFVAIPQSTVSSLSVIAETEGYRYTYENTKSVTFTGGKPYRIKGKTFERTESEAVVNLKVGSDGSEVDYSVFNNALAAANSASDSCTLTLLGDIALYGDVPEITNGNGVLLNLSDHTITTGSNSRIAITGENARLTISGGTDGNGTIKAADGTEGSSPVMVKDKAQLTINSGKFTSAPNNSKDIDAAVYAKTGGRLIINGGTFTSSSSDEGAVGISSEKGEVTPISKLTINGGTITGTNTTDFLTLRVIRSDLEVNGGEINGRLYTTGFSDEDRRSNKTIITGGKFEKWGSEFNKIYLLDINDQNNINISGGVFKARSYICNFEGSGDEVVIANISDGDFKNDNYGYSVVRTSGAGTELVVTGGNFFSKGNTTYPNHNIFIAANDSKIYANGGTYNYPVKYDLTLKKGTSDTYFVHEVVRESEDNKQDYERVLQLKDTTRLATALENGTSGGRTLDRTFYFADLASATAAASRMWVDSRVTLEADDLSMTKDAWLSNSHNKTITLDLNNHTIESDHTMIRVTNKAVITDLSSDKGGKVKTTTCAIHACNGTNFEFTVDGGTYEGANQYGAIRVAGTGVIMNVSDGVVVNNTATEQTKEYAAIHLGQEKKDGTPTVNISGGKFTSNTHGIRCRYGILNIEGGKFYGDSSAINIGSSDLNQPIIKGGYFAKSAVSTKCVIYDENTTPRINQGVSGGFFTDTLINGFIKSGYKQEGCSETQGEITYTNKVVVDPSAKSVAEVNGTGYTSLSAAYEAAMAISDSVTIKLLADATITGTWFFEKAGTKGTCLDLNGHNISTAVDSLFSPKTTLTITDSNSGTKGIITSTKVPVVTLNSNYYSTVNINNCTISSTAGTSTSAAVIRISGGKTNSDKRIINIGENAKIIGNHTALYVQRGTMNISSNAEITANRDHAGASALYFYTLGQVYISDNASFKGYNAVRSGSTNTEGTVTITGGYFFASGENGKILYNSANGSCFKFNGGYYNKEVNSTTCPNATIKNGAAVAITPVSHSHGGVSLSYDYQIQ